MADPDGALIHGASMLYVPARHEPLQHRDWDEAAAVRMIERIVRDCEERFSPESHWPLHPLDVEDDKREPQFDFYCGAGGVVWALHYLEAAGAVELRRSYGDYVATLPALNRSWLKSVGYSDADAASFMGETGLLLLGYALSPNTETAARLEALIAGNLDHPRAS
jgi:hypothetical protein